MPVGVGAGVVGTAVSFGVGAGPVGTAASPALVAGLAGRLGVGTLSGLGEALLLGAREKLTRLSAFGVASGLRALLRSDSAEVLRLGEGGATFSFSPSCLKKQSVVQVAPVPLPFAEGGAAGCLQLGLTWARSNLATSSFFVAGADFAAVARNPGSVFAGVCDDEAGEGGTAREGVTRRCVLGKRGLALFGLGTLLLGLAAKVSLVGLGLASEPSASLVLALPAEGAGFCTCWFHWLIGRRLHTGSLDWGGGRRCHGWGLHCKRGAAERRRNLQGTKPCSNQHPIIVSLFICKTATRSTRLDRLCGARSSLALYCTLRFMESSVYGALVLQAVRARCSPTGRRGLRTSKRPGAYTTVKVFRRPAYIQCHCLSHTHYLHEALRALYTQKHQS